MMKNNLEYLIAKEKAVKYIGISKKTKYEVKQKLTRLKISNQIIENVLNELETIGYIDDNEYTFLYLNQNIKMAKYSIYEIKQRLLQKGIKTSIIEEKIIEVLPKDYEKDVIYNLKRSKLKDYEPIKQREYLYRRGFILN